MTTARYLKIAGLGIVIAAGCLVLAQVAGSSLIAVAGAAILVGVVAVREYWQHSKDRTPWQAHLVLSVIAGLVAAAIALTEALR